MNDTIKKLAIEWKEADKAMIKARNDLNNPNNMNLEKCYDIFHREHEKRNTCANILAMAIAQELGL